jgi:hypothetical protein
METNLIPSETHPAGEPEIISAALRTQAALAVETFGGRVHVEWNPQAAVTPLGQLPFFIEFLKTAELFAPWVQECPLERRSPNAPANVDLLGTLLLSVLAGQRRYAHITAIRADGVNPELLGMSRVLSEDAVRRSFVAAEEAPCAAWLQKHLQICYGPLLGEPWILDVDTTVKPLYGHQEGAVVGFNPQKPGRPSHTYHTYFVANLRLVLDVEVQAGNHTAALYSRPGLWALLERLGPNARPAFIRGDCAWGNEGAMVEAEEQGVDYLFKLKQSSKVRRLIEQSFAREDWRDAGQGWQGVEDALRLSGWTRARRVIVLRRPVKAELALGKKGGSGQLDLSFMETLKPGQVYEYAVLVSSLGKAVLTLAQHYRDRADAENNFDEIKNQWGWGGYTTQDLKRCRIMARVVALIYNWWSLFVRLAIPERHAEAITSRPLLLHAIARLTRHGGRRTVSVTSTHGKMGEIKRMLEGVNRVLGRLRRAAEQLSRAERWRWLLSVIFRIYLGGRLLKTPPLVESSAATAL